MRSVPLLASFDAFYLADLYLQQLALLIAGDKAWSLWHTTGLAKKLNGRVERLIIPNTTHMDFYDQPFAVDWVVKAAGDFSKSILHEPTRYMYIYVLRVEFLNITGVTGTL